MSKTNTPMRELFVSDVTRDIPPVVYFHEQDPLRVASEIDEYIITGGWPDEHPNHRRVPDGIHEQYVKLLTNIKKELDKTGGPALPTAWISGFYGSGKSSFAKLLGMALDGTALPDGRSAADAWLKRDISPRRDELAAAWSALRGQIDPIAVVFDIGAVGRDNEHIHAAIVRQVQQRLGYCSKDALVADFELGLERRGQWQDFLKAAEKALGRPWDDVKDRPLAEEEFSQAMHELEPERYEDPMAWIASRAGMKSAKNSPEEAVTAIDDMLKFRQPDATLFVVVDEVSQYVLSHKDRVDRLRAFASALGAKLRGKAWLLALGQQKVDEEAGDSFLVWAKDRFPPNLRVHLSATNIRDVIHQRLLRKTEAAAASLSKLFDQHRANLKLYAYGCEGISSEEFVETYPLLPEHIDLLLQVTSALRTRSSRAQGDDQAIRGLLQMLGELFRSQNLADADVGTLISFDMIYEVQQTALGSDAQHSMARILNQCAEDEDPLLVRAAKAVALLELVSDTLPTTSDLVAKCLYDRLDRGDNKKSVEAALEELKQRNLLGYSEKTGYKLQSSAGEEWERDRRDIPVATEKLSDIVKGALDELLARPERPKLEGTPFPWAGRFSDGHRHDDVVLKDPRDGRAVWVDFRYLAKDDRSDSAWAKRSDESALADRIVWVCGEPDELKDKARELARSQAMVRRFKPRKESLSQAKKLLLQQEENRVEDLQKAVMEAVASTWLAGRIYFRGESIDPKSLSDGFTSALFAAAEKKLPVLFDRFVGTNITPSELSVLLDAELSGPSSKFLPEELGLLELDGGKYVSSCEGVVPKRILEFLDEHDGAAGSTLDKAFGGPPYGYSLAVIKACTAGLLRGSKVKVQTESGANLTAIRDANVRDVFEKDRDFKRATFYPAGDDDIGYATRSRICAFFDKRLEVKLNREDNAIADAVQQHFPHQLDRVRALERLLKSLPPKTEIPDKLGALEDAFVQCLKNVRLTQPTVRAVKRHLDALHDGMQILGHFTAELTDDVVADLRAAADVRDHEIEQLQKAHVAHEGLLQQVDDVLAQLDSKKPWQGLADIADALSAVKDAYKAERKQRILLQEEQAQAARSRLKARAGFATLTADQAHKVLRPIKDAQAQTGEDAYAPTLLQLKEGFEAKLREAEDHANDILDQLLSEKPGDEGVTVEKVRITLKGREISTQAELDALLDEVRSRIEDKLDEDKGIRVRIIS